MARLKNIIITAAVILAGLSSEALAAKTSCTTNVAVRVPEFIVLHYYSSVTLNFDRPTAEALDEGAHEVDTDWQGETCGEGLGANSLMSASLELEGARTNVTLNNVWAVRGFSSSGNAKIEVTVPAGYDTMSNGDSKIALSNVQVCDGANKGACISTKLNGMSGDKATVGNIEMELDFSQTTRSGSHTGGQYTITATTI